MTKTKNFCFHQRGRCLREIEKHYSVDAKVAAVGHRASPKRHGELESFIYLQYYFLFPLSHTQKQKFQASFGFFCFIYFKNCISYGKYYP